MTSQTPTGTEHQDLDRRTVRDVVEYSPAQVNEAWCRKIFRRILQSLELQYGMHMPHRPITPDTVVFHDNGEPLLVPSDLPVRRDDESGDPLRDDLTALAGVVHYAITGELKPEGPLHGRGFTGYSDALLTAVDRCMAPDPEQRPRTIDEVRNILGIVPLHAPLAERPLPEGLFDDIEPDVPRAGVAEADAVPAATAHEAQQVPDAVERVETAAVDTAAVDTAAVPEPEPATAPPQATAAAAPAARTSEPGIAPPPTAAAAAPGLPVTPTGTAGPHAPAAAPTPPVNMAQSATEPSARLVAPSAPTPARAAAPAASPAPAPAAAPSGTPVPPPKAPGASRPGAGLGPRQRWAIAAGAGAILLAFALVMFAQLRDSDSYDQIALSLPQQADAPPAAPAASAGPDAPPADASALPAPVADGTLPEASPVNPNDPTGTIDEAAADSAPDTAAGAPNAPAAPGSVTYRLQIQPWGVIHVDGVDRGVSPPVKRLTLAPGRHTVRVSNPNFQDRTLEIDTARGAGRIAVDFNREDGQPAARAAQ